MARITIETANTSRDRYDVLIEPGGLAALGEQCTRVAPAHRYVVITDRNVERDWSDAALGSLRAAGLRADLIAIEAGEAAKTRQTWSTVSDRMLALGAGRDTVVIALGGGVVGDLAGFVAATYMRGLPVIQVPTSLLAMIDASVGGKTGVDTASGKNLIGAFHQPALVLVDPEVLRTLPAAELTNGMAEAIKHGAIASRAYFDWITTHAAQLRPDDTAAFTRLIAESVRIKASFVSADVREHGPRAALNFGHTVGHELELSSGYQLRHGHAVAIGMVMEALVGERLGVTAAGSAQELAAALQAVGLPTRPEPTAGHDARLDKKARAGKARYVLLAGIGEVARGADGAWTFEVEPALVSAVLTAPLR